MPAGLIALQVLITEEIRLITDWRKLVLENQFVWQVMQANILTIVLLLETLINSIFCRVHIALNSAVCADLAHVDYCFVYSTALYLENSTIMCLAYMQHRAYVVPCV